LMSPDRNMCNFWPMFDYQGVGHREMVQDIERGT
jgi:hypothetical protein